jgi:hypothetical protein
MPGCRTAPVCSTGEDPSQMLRVLSIGNHGCHIGEEPFSELPVCGRIPPLVVAQVSDLWLKLRHLAAI